MPCRDDYPEPSAGDVRRELEPLLCEAITLLRERAPITYQADMSLELRKWSDDHKKRDDARRAREAKEKADKLRMEAEMKEQLELKKQALKKLTPKERKALGLK